MYFTSITLENFCAHELGKEIANYVVKKGVSYVNVVCSRELGGKTVKRISLTSPTRLSNFLEQCMTEDGVYFSLDIPEIKTIFEEFIYGIDANSSENDFRSTFSKYV